MSQRFKNGRAFWLVPVTGATFLAFMLGLGLGTTGRPPSGLLRTAIGGVSDLVSYSRDAIKARPSQHLRPRGHDGNGVTISQPDRMQPGVTLLSGLFGQTLGFRLYAADGALLKEWPIDFFKIAPDEMNHRYHALIHGDRKGLINGLALTVGLGILFSFVQAYEYMHAPFAFKESIYGATFFMATGFHGFHVLIGTIFLIVCLVRASRGDFTPKQHFGFEAAAWYWHFVDVVWLFLFASIYVWASSGATIAAGH